MNISKATNLKDLLEIKYEQLLKIEQMMNPGIIMSLHEKTKTLLLNVLCS